MKKVILIITIILFLSLFSQNMYKKKTNKCQENFNLQYNYILKLLRENKYLKVIEKCKKVIEQAYNSCQVYDILVQTSKDQNKLNGTIKYFTKLTLDNPKNPYFYYGLGLCFKNQNKLEKAIYNFKKSIGLNAEFPNVYEELINCPQSKEQLEALITSFKKNIKSLPQNPCLYYGLGLIYMNLSDYEPSLKNLRQGLETAQGIGDKSTEERCLENIGHVHWKQSNYPKALENYKKSLKIAQEINNKNQEIRFLINIGKIYSILNKYSQALEYYNLALKINRKIKDKSAEASCLNGIGIIHRFLDEYSQALKYFKQSLIIIRELDDKNYEGIALNNIAVIYERLENYSMAIEYYNLALKIFRGNKNKYNTGICISNIGNIYDSLGKYSQALKYYEQALEIANEIGNKKGKGLCLHSIGFTYSKLNKYSQALTYYRHSLKIIRDIRDKYREGECLSHIGFTYNRLKKYLMALNYYKQAFEIAKEIGSNYFIGSNLISIGETNYLLKNYLKSIDFYTKALSIGQEIRKPDIIREAYYGLALNYEKIGKLHQAMKYYKKAIEIIENVRDLLGSEEFKSGFLESKIKTYESLVNLLFKLHQKDSTKGYDRQAFNFSERAKARSFLDSLYKRKQEIKKGIPLKLLNNKIKLEYKISNIQTDLIKESSKFDKNNKIIKQLEKELDLLKVKHQELLLKIEINHPRYASLTGISEPLYLKDVQDVLEPEEILIEYSVSDEQIIVFVISRDSFNIKKINISRKELNEKIKALRKSVEDFKKCKIDFSRVSFNLKLAHELYLKIFALVEEFLNKNSQLIIVPDDVLFYLPFEALVTSFKKVKTNSKILFSEYENAYYLLKKYPISYSTSASILDPKLKRTKRKNKGKLLAFGNPYFGNIAERVSEYCAIGQLRATSHGLAFKPLPKSEKEVEEISDIFKNENSVIYKGKEAKEEHFKEESGNYEIIHVATHGIVDETQPLYSTLVLTLDEDLREDGLLQSFEIYNLNLNCNLVTLSACETGLGELRKGEGIIGLTRAFLYAGASSVVASLWSVDESTSEIMKYFYQGIKKGLNPAKALRNAKLKIMKKRNDANNGIKYSFSHPFLWAPFIIVGNNNPLNNN